LESLGWDGMAFTEGQGGAPDPYVCLAVAATGTSWLKLGTGVSVPTRHPQVTANTMATVSAIAGGRMVFSLGRGDGAMHQMGQTPMPVRQFERYVERLQGYLRRDVVDLDGFPSTIRSLFERDPSLPGWRMGCPCRWAPTWPGCGNWLSRRRRPEPEPGKAWRASG
jgi:5,10-methylenetetrahydromethanopterin reductase